MELCFNFAFYLFLATATSINNNFSAYGSSYSPRSVTPITSMAASAAAAVAATTAAYPHVRGIFDFQYLVQLIEYPILRIPNILFVYFLSIFSR